MRHSYKTMLVDTVVIDHDLGWVDVLVAREGDTFTWLHVCDDVEPEYEGRTSTHTIVRGEVTFEHEVVYLP